MANLVRIIIRCHDYACNERAEVTLYDGGGHKRGDYCLPHGEQRKRILQQEEDGLRDQLQKM